MALMTWNDRYSVGVKALDEQHKALVDTLNKLHEAMMKGQAKTITGPLLTKLVKYTQEHFAAEEKLMKATGYPGLVQHISKHQALIKQVGEFVGRYERGEITLSTDLLNFLRDWLGTHIQKEDKEYGPWLNKNGVF
ncbi:MAG: bacteriohemerythrin [Terracidiphilus sp.]